MCQWIPSFIRWTLTTLVNGSQTCLSGTLQLADLLHLTLQSCRGCQLRAFWSSLVAHTSVNARWDPRAVFAYKLPASYRVQVKTCLNINWKCFCLNHHFKKIRSNLFIKAPLKIDWVTGWLIGWFCSIVYFVNVITGLQSCCLSLGIMQAQELWNGPSLSESVKRP